MIFKSFPSGSGVKNPPANTRDTDWTLGQGRSPPAMEEASVCARTIEHVLQSPGATTSEPMGHKY